jgi:hypothetical protein
MVAPVVLVEAVPRQALDGAPVTVRLAGGGAVFPYRYSAQHWRAGLAGLPQSRASLDFDGEQLGGGGSGETTAISWAPSTRAALAELSALYWTDAPITVRVGPEGAALPAITTMGLVQATTVDGGVLKIAFADQTADLKRPLLVDRFLGTGGIEGPSEFTDLIKSRAWGRCFNVPGRQIDAATNVWSFGDPRRPWQAFGAVRDMGVAASNDTLTVLSWQGSAEATFAALQGTHAIDGGGVLCPSIACVKWWTTPAGDLHADIQGETDGGYVETAAEIVARIVAARSTIPFAVGAVAAAAAARPAPFGWRVDTDSATAAAEISEMLGGVSTSWLVVDGAIVFRHWDWTPPTRVARSFAVTRKSSVKPTASRKLGYRRNWSPMARGDLAAIVLSTDVLYEDGTPIEDLKPAEPGATSGAPEGTDVAGMPARTAINALAELAGTPRPDDIVAGARALVDRGRSANESQLAAQLLAQVRKDRLDALTHLDGIPMGTRVRREVAERIDADGAIVTQVEELSARVTDGVADTTAALLEEATIRATADLAETEQRELAVSQLTGVVDGERIAREAAILEEASTRATAISAETSQRESAVSSLAGAIGDEAAARVAAISSERTTSATELAAETAGRELAVSTVVGLVDAERVSREAAIIAEATTRADALGAETSEREAAVSSLLGAIGDETAARTAAIASERTTSATELAAETALRVTAISTVTGLVDDERSAREAAISGEAATRADAVSAETAQREAAISTLTGVIGDEAAARMAAIASERTTSATELAAETAVREAAISSFDGLVEAERVAREAAILDEATTRADADGATATQLLSLATDVGEHSASINFLLETTNGEQAVAQLTTDVNGRITGFRINGAESEFLIAADRFVVGDSSIFEVSDGIVRIKNAIIGQASIGTGNLAPNATGFNKTVVVNPSPAIIGTNDTAPAFQDIAVLTFVCEAACDIFVQATWRQVYASSSPFSWDAVFLLDGATFPTQMIGYRGFSETVAGSSFMTGVAAGAHTLRLAWRGYSPSISIIQATLRAEVSYGK